MTEEKSQISASLPVDLVNEIDALAALVQQDRAWILQRALELYLADEGAELRETAAGLAELDAGQFRELDDVLKEASSIVDRAETIRARRAG
jgi:predicted transcriptional regulator